MYLLDTNACIALLSQQPGHEGILMRMDGLEYGQVVISAITTAELRFGVDAGSRVDANRLRLERFLANFEVAAFDDVASRHYGAIRAQFKAQGTPIGPLDT